MSISKREKTLILVALVFAVFCLYYFFFFKPYSDDMKALGERLSQSRSDIQNNEMLEYSVATLTEEIAEDRRVIAELSEGVAQGFDQPPLLAYLERTVNQHAVKQTFYFSGVHQVGQLNVCPVTVMMSGDYAGVKNVLSALSDGEYFVKVISLNIMRDSQQRAGATETAPDDETETAPKPPSGNTLNVTLSLEFYSLLGDTDPGIPYTFDEGHQYGGDIFD